MLISLVLITFHVLLLILYTSKLYTNSILSFDLNVRLTYTENIDTIFKSTYCTYKYVSINFITFLAGFTSYRISKPPRRSSPRLIPFAMSFPAAPITPPINKTMRKRRQFSYHALPYVPSFRY